jgi:hypothetical protein
MTRLRVDAPKFIPSPIHNFSDGQEKHELRWQGVCLFPDNTKGGHVSPQANISDPVSSEVMAPQSSAQGSNSQNHRQQCQCNAHCMWKNLPTSISDPVMIKPQQDFIIETIMAQYEENCSFLKDVAWKDLQIIVKQMICRDSRSMIPQMSTSSDIISGGFMGRTEAFTKWSECKESPKKESRHGRCAKQAAKAYARRKRASQKSFEVLASMPVGFTGGDENSSETSSTSTHFKRKKSKKNDVYHHPVTRSLTSSGNESIFIGSYNLLYSNFTHPENELWDAAGLSGFLHIEGGPSRVEQVLATNEVQTVEEQMAQLTAVLQQKEDELAALRQQTTALQQ